MEQLNLGTLPRTRKEAEALGSKYYFTGKPCKRGHADVRYASSAGCKSCLLMHALGRLDQIAEWKKKNPEKAKAADARYRDRNREKVRQRSRDWSQAQRDGGTDYAARQARSNREYIRRRNEADPEFRWTGKQRQRLSKRIQEHGGRKTHCSDELIGCTWEFLRAHLESQFQPGMSWDNYALDGWHIDHIIPCASFDLTDPEQQKACFHYSNLQPLWALENIKKGASRS